MLSHLNSKEPSACLLSSYNGSADHTKVLLSDKQANLYGCLLENNHTADVFIQFFNAAATGEVTLGTTAPDLTIRLPASGAVIWDPIRALKNFKLGIVYAVTSTRTGSSAPGANASLTLFYSRS